MKTWLNLQYTRVSPLHMVNGRAEHETLTPGETTSPNGRGAAGGQFSSVKLGARV